ncbi:nitrite reductase (NADH) small subunit [Microbulbifer aestuariivivens]|uniref:Nitrite reductase (NADH) small subunit n=1 Tax=Microbulbifer aestuariivivens TaxID=1908308 RepID=A0ABP9WV50_9GAMM
MFWVNICDYSDIAPNTGVCASVHDCQVAIFREANSGKLFAIDNYDPIGCANVLSRGLLSSVGDKLAVASPLYKQHFDLISGECLEDASIRIPVYRVKEEGGKVYVALAND